MVFDVDRKERTGFPEAILAESKSYDDLLSIVEKISTNGFKENIIITRLSKERFDKLNQDLSYLSDEGIEFNYNKAAKTLVLYKGRLATLNPDLGKVGIITAGTSDIPVAEEAYALMTLELQESTGFSPRYPIWSRRKSMLLSYVLEWREPFLLLLQG